MMFFMAEYPDCGVFLLTIQGEPISPVEGGTPGPTTPAEDTANDLKSQP
jgi:hypothetical protein